LAMADTILVGRTVPSRLATRTAYVLRGEEVRQFSTSASNFLAASMSSVVTRQSTSHVVKKTLTAFHWFSHRGWCGGFHASMAADAADMKATAWAKEHEVERLGDLLCQASGAPR